MVIEEIDRELNVLVTTSYFLKFECLDSPWSGFSFPCDKEGNVDPDRPSESQENLRKCLNGTYNVRCCGVETYVHRERLCSCGSGAYPEDVYDARGIFVARVCDECRKEKLRGYRPEIFEESDYWVDEDVDPEEGVYDDADEWYDDVQEYDC